VKMCNNHRHLSCRKLGMEFHNRIQHIILGNVVQQLGFGFELGPASDCFKGGEVLRSAERQLPFEERLCFTELVELF
jgi:hypothetical protein